jgi:ATP-dependent Clp protease adaptor protein ClpS
MAYADTATKTRVDIKPPEEYKIVIFNDDYTPMTFVVELLTVVFGHNVSAAHNITMQVHEDGRGIAGVYYWEMAEQKLFEAERMIAMSEHPLIIKVEKA